MKTLQKRKILGIGWHKTGTTSLGVALEALGYSVQDSSIDRKPLYDNNIDQIISQLDGFDACQDCPWNLIYQDLYKAFPNGYFILTIRDENEWLKSVSNHFGTTNNKLREFAYGTGLGFPKGNEAEYLARYKLHNASVIDFFADKPNQLLILDLSKNKGWDKLCSFLSVDHPKIPFPHKNKRRKSLTEKILTKLKRH
ncbi:hypothetical protein OAF30_00325 [Flavobacteriales bacterium]|nr:hypothetical protein [Flavobacteriales bacterium]